MSAMAARPIDTDERAWRAQVEAVRRLGPDGRVRMAAKMSEDVRRIALDGIRRRHPEYDEGQARDALLTALYGEDLAQRVRRARPRR
jgi:hypothetical protein